MSTAGPEARWPSLRDAAIVLLLCAAVYLPGLGSGGLTNTEGHRAIPGWEMLNDGDWMLPRLFGQVYLRKLPGMSWAVAASSAVFGQTEFAARLPSALATTGLSLMSLVFGARWFGRRYGLASGAAAALCPLFWSWGRSAEIEALNNFATAAVVLLVLDLSLGGARRRGERAALAVVLGGAIALAVLAKGPAYLTAAGSAVVAGLALRARAGRGQMSGHALPWLGLAVVIAVGILAPIVVAIARAVEASGQQPVTQGVSEFLWNRGMLSAVGVLGVLAMAPVALATALPASLGLLFPWGPDARAEAGATMPRSCFRLALALGLTSVLSLLMLTAAGVHNPRYAMPSLAFLPVLAGYVVRGAEGGFGARRAWIARGVLLGAPWRWAVLLMAGAAVFAFVIQPRQRGSSGRAAGEALAGSFGESGMVWADHMIEARPEVLWYAARAAERRGVDIRPVWVPGLAQLTSVPRSGGYLLLRSDAESGESEAFARAGLMDRLDSVASGKAHKYPFTLYRRR